MDKAKVEGVPAVAELICDTPYIDFYFISGISKKPLLV